MLGLSVWKLAILGGIVALMFGKGKISGVMGDVAQGIKSFRRGMSEDETPATLAPAGVEAEAKKPAV